LSKQQFRQGAFQIFDEFDRSRGVMIIEARGALEHQAANAEGEVCQALVANVIVEQPIVL
jgi:hypothetical protein